MMVLHVLLTSAGLELKPSVDSDDSPTILLRVAHAAVLNLVMVLVLVLALAWVRFLILQPPANTNAAHFGSSSDSRALAHASAVHFE